MMQTVGHKDIHSPHKMSNLNEGRVSYFMIEMPRHLARLSWTVSAQVNSYGNKERWETFFHHTCLILPQQDVHLNMGEGKGKIHWCLKKLGAYKNLSSSNTPDGVNALITSRNKTKMPQCFTYLQACKYKFRLRDLTSCSCSAAASAVCFECQVAVVDTTETGSEFSQPKL